MTTSSADRVMHTVTRYFDVEAQDPGRAGPAAEAARRASADPEFHDALAQVLEEVSRRRSLGAYSDAGHDGTDPDCLGALARLFEADPRRGSFRACTAVSRDDSGIDVVARLPDDARCGPGQVYALEAKIFDAAEADPEARWYLILLLVAAIHLDRSSLGTADAWSMRRESSASDITAVRTALRRLADGEKPLPAAEAAETGEPRDPERPSPGPDPLCISTLAEFTAALARLRAQAGMPTYREMSRRGRPGASPSTLLAVTHGERLPSLRAVSAFVTGCGGSAEELGQFTAAWQRIRLSDGPGPVSGPPENSACPVASPAARDAGTPGCRSGAAGPGAGSSTVQ